MVLNKLRSRIKKPYHLIGLLELIFIQLKLVDLTGAVIAADDVIDNTDFYEGIFQSYFVWCADYSDGACNDFRTEPDPSEYSGFAYGYMNGPLGFTWGINWAKW